VTDRLDRGELLRLGAGAAAVGAVPASVRRLFAHGGGFPQAHPRWRFVFVNHALTNPFFVPAKNGSHDAASLLGVDVSWTGSTKSDAGQMVKAMRHAIAGDADGIAVSIVDPTAFNGATRLALSRGIPVVSYNADGGKQNKRLAYIGQDNYQSGLELGARLVSLCSRGDVYLFIATPGQANIQPRIDGALDAIRDSGKPIRTHVVSSGVSVGREHKKIEATYLANRNLRGLFAVDAGSTAGVADVMRKYRLHKRGVRAGGYDLLPATLRAIHDRDLDFTIDQQPYLQGFLPVLQMFLYRYSGHLVAPADTNTGLNFVTRQNVVRYLTTKSRFEGSSSRDRYPVR
jgi:simple sugar transport system substrate-binding protein